MLVYVEENTKKYPYQSRNKCRIYHDIVYYRKLSPKYHKFCWNEKNSYIRHHFSGGRRVKSSKNSFKKIQNVFFCRQTPVLVMIIVSPNKAAKILPFC